MKVLKFGGTSVGTPDSLRNVKEIVEACETPVIVVVSALGGLTDKLIATAKMAAAGDTAYLSEMAAIKKRHLDVISAVVPVSRIKPTTETVMPLLDGLARVYDGVFLINDLPKRTLDVIVSFGERISSHIVAAMVNNAVRMDSLEFIKTEKWFGKDIADRKLTDDLIKRAFADVNGVVIVPGFISTDRETGDITNLGRGGSDFTAALIAASLDASLLEIWTDVDGFMTADPRIIPEARVLPSMTFTESMELCSYGAKVIYPPTIYPVFHKNIPIKILNTFNPKAPGTLINEHKPGTVGTIKGISSVNNIAYFTVSWNDPDSYDEINSRALNALSKQGISTYPAELDKSRQELSFAISEADAKAANALLESEFAPELFDGKCGGIRMGCGFSVLAIVGDDMDKRERLAPRIINTLQRNDIEVMSRTRNVSETTMSFVVEASRVKDALRLVHDLVFCP